MRWEPIKTRAEAVLRRLLGRPAVTESTPRRGAHIHVVILDGTMSSLERGWETHAGMAYKLLLERGSDVSVYYEPGLQWTSWRHAQDVFAGRGINRQIRRAYGWLASRYRPGDKIYFLGFSRGAYAVRSLAGVIDLVGLLRPEAATERNIREIYRHYQCETGSDASRRFADLHCHDDVSIEMIGAWDTVKSLGLNMPVLWRLTAPRHAFHNHMLGDSVKNGFHALARNETRVAYAPVLWETREDWPGERLEQMWFRGTHGDVGGQLGDFPAGRPLGNIPFVWLMERAESVGLPLPDGWAERFPQDATAPSGGTFRGLGRWLITRKPRKVGLDPSESLHPSVPPVSKRNWRHIGLPAMGWVKLP